MQVILLVVFLYVWMRLLMLMRRIASNGTSLICQQAYWSRDILSICVSILSMVVSSVIWRKRATAKELSDGWGTVEASVWGQWFELPLLLWQCWLATGSPLVCNKSLSCHWQTRTMQRLSVCLIFCNASYCNQSNSPTRLNCWIQISTVVVINSCLMTSRLSWHSPANWVVSTWDDQPFKWFGRKSPLEPTPPIFGTPVGVTPLEFRLDFWHRKTNKSPLAIVRRRLRDPKFSRLSRTPTCDRQTDGQTDDDGKYHFSIASRG